MTIHGGLAYAHNRCYAGKGMPARKPQLHHAPCLWRNVVGYKGVDSPYSLFIGPLLAVIFLVFEKKATLDAPVDLAVAYVVEAAVSDRSEQVSSRDDNARGAVEQRDEHIIDDDARKVIVVHQYS